MHKSAEKHSYILIGNSEEKGHLGNTDMQGRVILNWIIKEEDIELNWIRMKFIRGLL
jgi:hypothetical protein